MNIRTVRVASFKFISSFNVSDPSRATENQVRLFKYADT